MKVVINRCHGGFGLSDQAYEQLIAWGIPVRTYDETAPASEPVIYDRTLSPPERFAFSGRYWDNWIRDDARTHPLLVRVVEELGPAANGAHAALAVVEIPDDVAWHIEEYDGAEHVAEDHRTWG